MLLVAFRENRKSIKSNPSLNNNCMQLGRDTSHTPHNGVEYFVSCYISRGDKKMDLYIAFKFLKYVYNYYNRDLHKK